MLKPKEKNLLMVAALKQSIAAVLLTIMLTVSLIIYSCFCRKNKSMYWLTAALWHTGETQYKSGPFRFTGLTQQHSLLALQGET